jgi:hypothetical protein
MPSVVLIAIYRQHPMDGPARPDNGSIPSNSHSDDGSMKVPTKKSQGAAFPFDNLSNSWLGAVGIAFAIGIAYFMAARFGLAFRAKPGGVAVFWPAAGIAIGALIALGPNARLPVATGVIVATITSKLLITGNLRLPVVRRVVPARWPHICAVDANDRSSCANAPN